MVGNLLAQLNTAEARLEMLDEVGLLDVEQISQFRAWFEWRWRCSAYKAVELVENRHHIGRALFIAAYGHGVWLAEVVGLRIGNSDVSTRICDEMSAASHALQAILNSHLR